MATKIPKQLAPYFEVCFILCFGWCKECGKQVAFESSHSKFSDAYWLDQAAAMKDQGWVISKALVAHCAQCAQQLDLHHDPHAHTFKSGDLC